MQLIADNLHIIHPGIQAAVAEKNPGPIRDLVKQCMAAGADGIDINSGPLSRDPEGTMTFLVETVEQVSERIILIDTTNPKAIRAGVNYISRVLTSRALLWMKLRRGSTSSPIRMVKISSVSTMFSTCTWSRVRVSGLMVVSQS